MRRKKLWYTIRQEVMQMSEYVHKSHSVSVLLYHYVCPAKYRRVIFNQEVDKILVKACQEISKRYEINYLEIGNDGDHVHFLIQSIPNMSPSQIANITKSITAREIRRLYPKVNKQLWGGQIWSEGYFVSTVGRHGNEVEIENYIRNQGTNHSYQRIHRGQLSFFE